MAGENKPMSVSQITSQVYLGLAREGYRGRIVSIQHIADLKEEIKGSYNEGVFDEVFFQERLTRFEFSIFHRFPGANSIIITSAPQPQQRVSFSFKRRTYHLTVPPTYSYETDGINENILSDILKPKGFKLYPAKLPEKLLAVRSGLAKYGKNNITYIEGMGSFHRIKVFLSDLPAIEDDWLGLQVMEQCNKCSACVNKCQPGAIAPHRFLIQAEKCLTFHNERQGEFPDWIEPSWHNCLIGCMGCQIVCPANKKFFNWFEEKESFTEKETELILKGTSCHKLPRATANKLQRLNLLEDLDIIPRNLNVLIKQHSP
jgi:epoxyqueuosine reductase